jgi:predicted DNA-binding ribbon-helix-helix protein
VSRIIKRSVAVGSRKTSISLEKEFWEALWTIAETRKTTMAHLLETIEKERERKSVSERVAGLSSEIRIFVLREYKGT